jgi:hypothetical protein
VSEYPTPRRVVLELADLRRLTILERARACAVAGIAEADIGPLLRAVTSRNGSPETLERAVTVLYAIAYQLARRVDPSTSWDDAQTWDLALDLERADPEADAEARASVEASLATGLPPDQAGSLTLAQLDAYRELRPAPRGATRRVARRRAG